jgi:hypothetical protein
MSSGPHLRDPRRAARVPAHCPVVVRQRFFRRWRAHSEDLGPTGCRLVTPRVLNEGSQVRLFIWIPRLDRTFQGIATVVWTHQAEPSRVGLRFQPGKWERKWFDSLLATEPRQALAVQRRPSALPWRAELYLGTPRRRTSDFSREELSVLHRMKPAITVLELVASLGKASDRLVGALFSLVSRGQLVLDPATAQGPDAWRSVLSEVESLENSSEWLIPGRGLPTTEVQRLLAAGREHLAAGRISLAAELFRQARAIAPDDKDARAEVRNMGRYG